MLKNIKDIWKNFKRNLRFMWLRFRRNCYRASINYADRKLSNEFDSVIYEERKRYIIKLNNIKEKIK